MAKKPLPTPELLRQLLDYNPATGVLIWKARPDKSAGIFNARYAGTVAGTPIDGGGISVKIYGRNILAHRIIWAMVHDRWPQLVVHRNSQHQDNRLANLVARSRAVVQRNLKMMKTNTSGVRGVYWAKGPQKWLAAIKVGDKQKHLGLFDRKADAIAARKQAEHKLSTTGKV